MPDRPFHRHTIDEMEAVFRRSITIPTTLAALRRELEFRNTNRAKALMAQIDEAGRNITQQVLAEVGLIESHDRSLDADSPQATAARVKIAELRHRLLDLSNRNRLINFKHSPRGGRQIRIVGEWLPKLLPVIEGEKPVELMGLPPLPTDPDDERKSEFLAALEEALLTDKVYLRVIEKIGDEPDDKAEFALAKAERALRDRIRKRLGWPSRAELNDVSPTEHAKRLGIDPNYELGDPQPRRGKRRINHWQTLLSEDELERRLRALEHQARESREEYGVETLYLALGFLEWQEKTPGGAAEAPNLSPLVLVPISIEKIVPEKKARMQNDTLLLEDGESSRSRNRDVYILQPGAEEISVNLCLRERLRLDFGLELPDWDDELGLEWFLHQVTDVISDQAGWKIRRCATISHLAFNRLAMWVDLDPQKPGVKPPHLHPVLGELFGGGQSPEGENASTPGEDEEAGVPSLVMDCDSSQFAAIKSALSGRNLTIQGPPGTGKSQTIANLIASYLHQGKSVLFVAEKMAALDVVQSRLNDTGIGDFLLELHSAKAGKKPVLDSIRRRLNRRRQRHAETTSIARRRLALRDKLNAYATAVNATFGVTGMTVHEILWRCYEYREKPLPERLAGIRLPEVARWDREAIEQRREALDTRVEIELRYRKEKTGAEHPWFWVDNPRLHVQECDQVYRRVLDLRLRLRHLREWLQRVQLVNLPTSFHALRVLAGELHSLGSRPDEITPGLWVLASRTDAARLVETVTGAWQKSNRAEEILAEIAPAAVAEVELAHPRLTQLSELARRILPQAAASTDAPKLQQQKAANAQLLATLQSAIEMMGKLDALLVLQESNGARELDAMARCIELASHAPRAMRSRRHGLGEDGRTDFMRAKLAEMESIATAGAKLQLRTQKPIASLSLAIVEEHRIELSRTGIFSFLRARHRAGKRFCQESFPGVPKTEWIDHLAQLSDHLRRRQAMESDAELQAAAGELYSGWSSDRAALAVCCAWVDDVRRQTPIIEAHAAAIRKALFSLSQDQAELAEKLAQSGWIQTFRELAEHCERQSVQLGDLTASLQSEQELLEETEEAMQSLGWRGSLDHARINHALEAVRARADANEILAAHATTLALLLPDTARSAANVKCIATALLRVRNLPIQDTWRQRLVANDSVAEWTDFGRNVEFLMAELAEIEHQRDALSSLTNLSSCHSQEWMRAPLDEWFALLDRSIAAERLLLTRAQLLASRARIHDLNLDEVARAMDDQAIQKFSGIADLFRCVYLRSMAFAALQEHPALAEFRNSSPASVRERFSHLDSELKMLQRQELIDALMGREVPRGNDIGLISTRTELGLLEHVANLEKPRTSVRELLRRSGRALQALKPCFMMSPLSVAQLIERGKMTFDVVIFDEASQVRPEDAMSSMARARQFVVVGDQMQLPPTVFGEKTHPEEPLDDEGAEETEETAAVESILELASAAYGRGRTLLWHYRSRDPALIAFSNREFYRNELLLFPCPSARNRSTGVKYVWVGGAYSARTNAEEARVCARAAVEFMRKSPDRSLGIVALNRPQADLIELELDKLLHDDAEAAAYRAKWAAGLEPLFVKNLENVQGDERDVIFISTVFADDESGRFFQRFGPINSGVGHRRLNVLFTRAKHQLVLFTSLPTEKIQLSESSHWGVRALKQYLDYARTGRLEQGSQTGRSEDSPFEIAVRGAVEKAGFQCEPQVGVAGFFIDLAIRHPRYPDHFMVGIECDGAAYHSTRSARDRDRLRQHVLESLGWKIFRIWSTDWFADPDGQLARLVDYLNRTKALPFALAHNEHVDFPAKFGRPRAFVETSETAGETKTTSLP